MEREDLIELFDKISKEKMEDSKKKVIIDKILLFNQYIEISPISLINVVEKFINIEKLGFIDKINEDLFVLLKNILCKNKEGKINEEDGLYSLDYLYYLVIPYNVIKCENEYDLQKFLGEFEIMVSYIEDDDSFLDMEKLRLYNEELYNIILFRISWILKNINNDKLKKGSFHDLLIIETTLSHLMTIYYFSYDKYGENTCILEDAYNIILDKFDRLKEYFKEKNVYSDLLSNSFGCTNNILREYEICKEILDDLNEKNKKKVKK